MPPLAEVREKLHRVRLLAPRDFLRAQPALVFDRFRGLLACRWADAHVGVSGFILQASTFLCGEVFR